MKVNDMLLQMAYAAGQIAQTTLPQTGNADQRTSDGKDFHTLLSVSLLSSSHTDCGFYLVTFGNKLRCNLGLGVEVADVNCH